MYTVYTVYVYVVHSLSGLRSFVIIVVIAVKRQGARRHQECIHICFLCAYNALCIRMHVQCTMHVWHFGCGCASCDHCVAALVRLACHAVAVGCKLHYVSCASDPRIVRDL